MHNKTVRRIAVIIGSDSDLPQCTAGLTHLAQVQAEGLCQVVAVSTMSVHRNLPDVLVWLHDLSNRKLADVIVAAAGWASSLARHRRLASQLRARRYQYQRDRCRIQQSGKHTTHPRRETFDLGSASNAGCVPR